ARSAGAEARHPFRREGLPGARLRRVPLVAVRGAAGRRAGVPAGGGDAGGHAARRPRSGEHHQGDDGRGGEGGPAAREGGRGGESGGGGGGEKVRGKREGGGKATGPVTFAMGTFCRTVDPTL